VNGIMEAEEKEEICEEFKQATHNSFQNSFTRFFSKDLNLIAFLLNMFNKADIFGL
jgi:hypothetical protein